MRVTPTAESIASLVEGFRFVFHDEDSLQRGLERALRSACLPVESEVRLTDRDRIDFLVGTTGVEVKTKGQAPAVAKQLQRYAASDRIDEIVLVTTKSNHQSFMPTEIKGKPVRVVWLGAVL